MSIRRDIYAENLSAAWVRALEAMLAIPGHAAIHFGVRIANPAEVEVAQIRTLADDLLELGNLQRIKSIRNTIFPDVWGRRYPEPGDLAQHYRDHYPTLRRFPKNKRGTYFGRVVAYPMGRDEKGEPFDQLTDLISKLRSESRVSEGATRARKLSSRYEVNIWKPGDLPTGMAFPCMAHMSFHLVGGRLHLVAHYRNQFLIERAYGNYLGLAQLQRYIASAVELQSGELMVLAGHASLDTHGRLNISAIRETVREALSHMPPVRSENFE